MLSRNIGHPLTFDNENPYGIFFFKADSEIDEIYHSLKGGIAEKRSQWYGKVSRFTTIRHVPKLSKLSRNFRRMHGTLEYNLQSTIAILPGQLGGELITSVHEEFMCALDDVRGYRKERREPENQNLPSNQHLTIYISVRFSQLADKKIRQLFLHQLFEKVQEVLKCYYVSTENPIINLDMYHKDAEQTGLFLLDDKYLTHFSGPAQSSFHRVSVQLSRLQKYISDLEKKDALVIDTLVAANELQLLGPNTGNKLNLTHKTVPNTISSTTAIESVQLVNALKASIDPALQRTYANDIEKLNGAATSIALLYNIDGVRLEVPVKYIDQRGNEYHVYLTPEFDKNRNRILKTFGRKVRYMDESGYKVKTYDFYFLGTVLSLTVLISVSYVTLRSPYQDSVEDIIQTVIAIISIVIGGVITWMMNTHFKGEALFDVLTFLRKIDTEEEFRHRQKSGCQLTDIIEVLRMSKKSAPLFFGGGPNTSFIRNDLPVAGLETEDPMPFPNLENIGYALFECEAGKLYLLDPWNNVFKVFIMEHSKSVPKFRDRKENEQTYIPCVIRDSERNRQSQQPSRGLNSTLRDSMGISRTKQRTLFFSALNVEPFDRNIIGNIDGKDGKCIQVTLKSTEETIYLSRILPYQARYRSIGNMGRYSRYEVNWQNVSNKQLLNMNVGIPRNVADQHSLAHGISSSETVNSISQLLSHKISFSRFFHGSTANNSSSEFNIRNIGQSNQGDDMNRDRADMV